MPFVYCLNTSTIRPRPLLEKIRLAAKHGFQAIELWINDIDEHVAAGGSVADVRKAAQDAGLALPSAIAMKGWGDAAEAGYPAAMRECERRMRIAAELGAATIVATPPLEPADLSIVSRRYRDLLAAGRAIGVRPTMEYLGFCRSVHTIAHALAIVDEARDAAAALVLDSFHTFRGGSAADEFFRVPVERIAHFHLDDAPSTPPREKQMDPDRVMPGDGVLNLRGEIEHLRKIGYKGAISLELFNPALWEKDPNEVLALGMERMRELME